jgi:hypothetical protein
MSFSRASVKASGVAVGAPLAVIHLQTASYCHSEASVCGFFHRDDRCTMTIIGSALQFHRVFGRPHRQRSVLRAASQLASAHP